jgi:hypothetical protein
MRDTLNTEHEKATLKILRAHHIHSQHKQTKLEEVIASRG